MTTTTKTTYVAAGSIRGCCPHGHKTEDSAAKCRDADRRACEREGGYSDRDWHRADCRAVLSVFTEPCSCVK